MNKPVRVSLKIRVWGRQCVGSSSGNAFGISTCDRRTGNITADGDTLQCYHNKELVWTQQLWNWNVPLVLSNLRWEQDLYTHWTKGCPGKRVWSLVKEFQERIDKSFQLAGFSAVRKRSPSHLKEDMGRWMLGHIPQHALQTFFTYIQEVFQENS